MPRQYLKVPFARKDEAKQAGARWDKQARRWYWSTLYGDLPEGLKQFAVPDSPPVPQSDVPKKVKSESAPRIDIHFDSVHAAVSNVHRMYKNGKNERTHRTNMSSHDSLSWYGVEGGSKAVLNCLENGFPEGAFRIDGFLESIDARLPIATGVNRMLVRGDQGDHLDIHAVYRGTMDKAWTSSKRRLKKSTGQIRICVDICANAGTSADALTWRGVAGAAMARILEKARYSVEITACMALRDFLENNAPSTFTMTTVVKPKAGRVDIDRLACTIGLAGFFRVVGFASATHAVDDMDQIASANLGWYADVSGLLPPDEKTTTLWVPQSVVNSESAMTWINDTIKLLQAAG